jgi:hypothetical protein
MAVAASDPIHHDEWDDAAVDLPERIDRGERGASAPCPRTGGSNDFSDLFLAA